MSACHLIYDHSDCFSNVFRRCEEEKAEGHPKWSRSAGDQARSRRRRSGEQLWSQMHWRAKAASVSAHSDVIVAEQSIKPQFFFFSNNSDVRVQQSAVSSHVKFRKVRLRQVQVPSSMFQAFFHELCSDELQWADMLMWDSCGVCT